MLEARPLVVDPAGVVLGGNMRLQAALELGLKEVPVIVVDWDTAKRDRFTITDNLSYGGWNWDQLANEWTTEALIDWGLDLWNPEPLEVKPPCECCGR